MIGNGWVSPPEQYASVLPFAYRRGLVEKDSRVAKDLETTQSVCTSVLDSPNGKNKIGYNECEDILQNLLKYTLDGDNLCYNIYDVRLRDTYPSCGMNWPPDLETVRLYLRRSDVVEALNVDPTKIPGWEECSGAVSSTFNADNSVPSVQLLPGLLESEIPVLLFSGDKDAVCNHIGTEEFIHNMRWSNGTGFETSPGVWAPRHDWTFEGEPTGIYQTARNLTYVLFYNASHMVPYDLPRQSRDMADRFMRVDIASIGGQPADSRIDGEKLPQTAVGGHPNSTAAEQQEKEKIKQTEWKAYAKSGEAVLVIVIIGVIIWGFFIWRSRRRLRGYRGVSTSNFKLYNNKRSGPSDIEVADFDESELDRLDSTDREHDHYAVGEDSDEENSEHTPTRASKETPANSGSAEAHRS